MEIQTHKIHTFEEYRQQIESRVHVIEENGPSKVSFADAGTKTLRTIAHVTQAATIICAIAAAILSVATILSSCGRFLSSSFMENYIAKTHFWNIAAVDFLRNTIFIPVQPLALATTAVSALSLVCYIANKQVTLVWKRKTKRLKAQAEFFTQKHSLEELAIKMKQEQISVDNVVKYRLLSKDTTTREYATFHLIMKDYLQATSQESKEMLTTYYQTLLKDKKLS